jgi:signal transduction histidine kinase
LLTPIDASHVSDRAGNSVIEVLDADDLLGIGNGADILVVDDDPATLAAYEAALAPLGRRVVVAESGIHALARLLEQDFALMLLDVSMPEMSGLETARQIRQRKRNKGLPIIFITGLDSSSDVMLEAYGLGALDFVIKPIPPEVLRAKARVYLQLQERTRALIRESEQLRDAQRRLGAAGEARRTAEEANRRKDEFLAMLSHELRNPLWTMATALETLKTRAPLAGELSVIAHQVEHLTHIVGDLLDVSRVTRGKIELRREAVALAAVVGETIEAARPVIAHRAHRVHVDIPADLLVDADRHRIRQVLDNIVDNAVRYTDHGVVEIVAQRDGDRVCITVRDNGRGIAQDLLPQVFEPFVQGEQSLDRSEGGLGIGLTLADTLIKLHGGTIEAHSDGRGTGATFTVRWPLAMAAGRPAGDPPAPAPVRTAGRRILIVDDNADAADMLALLLRGAGHDVTVAHDGAAALEVAPGFAPEVALLDIGLPVIDGLELARRLRTLDACRDTVLIAVTGYGQPGDRQRTREAGFAHHLVKPVMLKTIEALLAAP